MSKGNSRQEATPQAIDIVSPIMINSAPLDKEKSLHILHVDDDVGFLEVSKQILSDENNFEIDIATSVDEASKKMKMQTFDAVVSDYEMPIKNGLEFLKDLRTQKMDIPFILFTGKGREDVAVKALNLGVDIYLNKNGSPETVYCELADAINKTVERKKSIKVLSKSEAKYRALVENSLQGISILQTAPLRLVFTNDAMGKILGYSSQELMRLSPEGIMGLVHHEDRAVFFRRMENHLRGELANACYEFRGARRDGSIIWMSALVNRLDYEGQPAVEGMFLDINERKKAEEIVRKSEERYRELVNSVPEMVFECDLTGKITYISQRAIDFTGFSNEELFGRNMLDFLVSEDRKRAIENMKRSFAGENLGSSEYSLFRKDGTIYPTLVRTSRIISENKVVGLRGLVIEITERKKAEKALQESEGHYRLLAEREHITNEKLNVIGKLTRHDVRNKLTVVKANAYLLRKRVGSNPEMANYIASIEKSVEQTESLLEFSRIYEQIGTEQLKTVDVEECFNEAASFFPDLKNVKVTNECHGLSVIADSLLRQLFYNFIDNSMKHGEKISQIRVYYKKEGNEAKLFYEDDGVGISSANKPRTFSEGFTTGKGTGHGLYLAKRMMEVYGWKIEEIGEEGKGVKFVIAIPKTKFS